MWLDYTSWQSIKPRAIKLYSIIYSRLLTFKIALLMNKGSRPRYYKINLTIICTVYSCYSNPSKGLNDSLQISVAVIPSFLQVTDILLLVKISLEPRRDFDRACDKRDIYVLVQKLLWKRGGFFDVVSVSFSSYQKFFGYHFWLMERWPLL